MSKSNKRMNDVVAKKDKNAPIVAAAPEGGCALIVVMMLTRKNRSFRDKKVHGDRNACRGRVRYHD